MADEVTVGSATCSRKCPKSGSQAPKPQLIVERRDELDLSLSSEAEEDMVSTVIPRLKISVRFRVLVVVGVAPLGTTKSSCRQDPTLPPLLCLRCALHVTCFDAA